jgi:hypothetical protein
LWSTLSLAARDGSWRQRHFFAAAGWGIDLDIAGVADASAADDVVFLRTSDRALSAWTQTTWSRLPS